MPARLLFDHFPPFLNLSGKGTSAHIQVQIFSTKNPSALHYFEFVPSDFYLENLATRKPIHRWKTIVTSVSRTRYPVLEFRGLETIVFFKPPVEVATGMQPYRMAIIWDKTAWLISGRHEKDITTRRTYGGIDRNRISRPREPGSGYFF